MMPFVQRLGLITFIFWLALGLRAFPLPTVTVPAWVYAVIITVSGIAFLSPWEKD